MLNSSHPFITENQEEVYLNSYKISEGSLYAKPSEYTFVDFDSDGKEELVINISEDYGFYIVLHYDGTLVYGYEFVLRALLGLKTDGSFSGSNGADSHSYCRLSFENNKKNIKDIAIKDSTMGVFELNGKKVSTEEVNEFINDWNQKKNVNWIKIDENKHLSNKENISENELTQKVINLNKYLKVTYSGYSGAGHATVSLDKEQFYLDNISIIDFKDINAQRAYRALYKNQDPPIDIFFKYINHIQIENNTGLKNNDTILLEWNINDEKILNYFSINYTYSNEEQLVSGLTIPEEFNPMDYLSVDYANGYIKLIINTENISDKTLSNKIKNACYESYFTYDKNEISNIDHSILITYNKVDLNNENSIVSFIDRYGLIPIETSRKYKINNHKYKINNISDINTTFWNNAKTDCTNHLKTYSDQIVPINIQPLDAYYSYLDNDLVIVFKIDAMAQYIEWIDGIPTNNTIERNITYYYLATYYDLMYDENNKLIFSNKNYNQIGVMFRDSFYENQKYYTFDISGVSTPDYARRLCSSIISSDARGFYHYEFK